MKEPLTSSTHTQDLNEILDPLPLPYIELDRRGCIVRANRAAIDLNPIENGNLIGRMVWDLVAAEEMAPSFAAYCTALENHDVSKPVRYNVYDSTGQFHTYEFHRSLVLDEKGEAVGMRMLCVDVSRKLQKLAEARRTALWFKSALSSLAEAVLLTDVIGIILYLNPAAEEMLGWKSEELAGRLIDQALPYIPSSPEIGAPPPYSTAIEKPNKVLVTCLDARGRSLCIEFHSSPVVDLETGHISGVISRLFLLPVA
ncbi:PAS domain S-box protein [Telmatobacter bradus]|uniref:PAS domain-containing protein n=1 Tax=Telmatobacter bradus TaxID=474953 RepID=UPI003B42A3ED